MFKRYIKSKGSPSEKHILMLSKSIKMNIKSIRQQDKVDRNNSTYFNILMEDIRKNNDIPISTLELLVKDLDENPEVKNIISSIIENKKIESILIAKDSDSKTKKRL